VDGDLKLAASFLGDTEAMAERHYVKKTHETLLRPVTAIAEVLEQARAAA
jgi:hypothetical protein